MQAVILAGGKGRRLLPYTTVLPKPLMPIGDFSILDVILRQLSYYGFDNIVICTGYLHELIRAYIDSNKKNGLHISYTYEKEPLGTVGPLRLIEDLDEQFLVMNGDILTDLDYGVLIQDHVRRHALATIATYQREVYIDFGVLEKNSDNRIVAFREKPSLNLEVSMGIYVFSKSILEHIPEGVPFGFDQLMYSLTEKNSEVYSHPHDGYWLDIGRTDDYARAIEEFSNNRDRFLK